MIQLGSYEREETMNRLMVTLCGNCSMQEALSIITLLETEQIEAFFELLPSELLNGVLASGKVVVEPSHFLRAKEALHQWNTSKPRFVA